jgi:hypothetical protein
VLRRRIGDFTELLELVEETRRRHQNDEPLLPRKFVVAVLICRKLRKGHYWAGNDKGYFWSYDLAKGRGVDDRFSDVVPEVASLLLQHGILVFKTSKGKKSSRSTRIGSRRSTPSPITGRSGTNSSMGC